MLRMMLAGWAIVVACAAINIVYFLTTHAVELMASYKAVAP